MKLPARLSADPAVARAVELFERATKANTDAEVAFNGLQAKGIPPCGAPFDEAAAAARHLRARKYDEVHGTDTATAEGTAIATERDACGKAHGKSVSDAKAATARIDDARLEHEASDAVWHGARNQLWTLIRESAAKLLPELQTEYVQAAVALKDQALELRAVARALESPLAPYDNAHPFEFHVPLPWRCAEADEIARTASGGRVDHNGALSLGK